MKQPVSHTTAPRGGGISAETLHENMAVSSVEVHFHGGLKHDVWALSTQLTTMFASMVGPKHAVWALFTLLTTMFASTMAASTVSTGGEKRPGKTTQQSSGDTD